MKNITLLILLIGIVPQARARLNPATPKIAIIGDSGASGAVANPELNLTLGSILGEGIKQKARELQSHIEKWAGEKNPEGLFSTAQFPQLRMFGVRDPVQPPTLFNEIRPFDSPELSWGYMVGRKLNLPPEDILFAAQDGEHVTSLKHQLEQVAQALGGELPEKVFVSYTANDFCAEDVVNKPPEETVRIYRDNLQEQLTQTQSLKPHREGSTVYFLAPLPVLSEIGNPSVEAKRIPFLDHSVTCGELRSGQVAHEDVVKKIRQMCSSVLATKADDSARLETLKQVYAGFIQAQKDVLGAATANEKLKFVYIEGTSQIQLEGQDVANDCFHPGFRGHVKIAQAVLEALR